MVRKVTVAYSYLINCIVRVSLFCKVFTHLWKLWEWLVVHVNEIKSINLTNCILACVILGWTCILSPVSILRDHAPLKPHLPKIGQVRNILYPQLRALISGLKVFINIQINVVYIIDMLIMFVILINNNISSFITINIRYLLLSASHLIQVQLLLRILLIALILGCILYFWLIFIYFYSIFILCNLCSTYIVAWIYLVNLSLSLFNWLLLHYLSAIYLLIKVGLSSSLIVKNVSVQCQSLEGPLVWLVIAGILAFFNVHYWH